MLNATFDPGVLFASPDDWLDEAERCRFLQTLLDYLDALVEYDIQLFWTDNLENCLWEGPQSPPWRQDRDAKLQLVPIIYRKFRSRIRHAPQFSACRQFGARPAMRLDGVPANAQIAFTDLMHYMATLQCSVYLCLASQNLPVPEGGYTFGCNCHHQNLRPFCVPGPHDWLGLFSEQDYWPSTCDADGLQHFEIAVRIASRKAFGRDVAVQSFGVSQKFLESIIGEFRLQHDILGAVAKRLCLPADAIKADKGLKDEPVRGKVGIRRFKVTGGARIHYGYNDVGKLLFDEYFPANRHDVGLR